MLGVTTLDEALAARPPEMVSVAPETWALLERAHAGGALADSFASAWANGVAFFEAPDGLRGRRPLAVEWKGSHRAPGDEVAPIDLRIDHVFLVSCKYLSRILINASPWHVFDRLLQGSHGLRGQDWYAAVAPREYQLLYAAVRDELALSAFPQSTCELDAAARRELASLLRSGWPPGAVEAHRAFVSAVSEESARLWREEAATLAAQEALMWRLLRMGSAPYYVLGAATSSPLRLRIATPWDWRQDFRLRSFAIEAGRARQPEVHWRATVEDRHSRASREVAGHVEIRWSHGRFSGNPEAKVYLDTPHADVPGYFPLGAIAGGDDLGDGQQLLPL